MSIKQTEIGTISSLENFMYIFLLPTETVIVAHPVDICIIIQNKWHCGRPWKFKFTLAARPLLIIP
jgi:hypothetical protein